MILVINKSDGPGNEQLRCVLDQVDLEENIRMDL